MIRQPKRRGLLTGVGMWSGVGPDSVCMSDPEDTPLSRNVVDDCQGLSDEHMSSFLASPGPCDA